MGKMGKYWVGRLSRPILCKVDSKWCALWETHDKLIFLEMLISHVFLFDMVCAVLSSFQLQGPWFESIGLAEVDRNSVYDGTRNQMGCILVIAKTACAATSERLLLLLLLLLLSLLLLLVVEVVVAEVVGGCAASRGARAGSSGARAGPRSASANKPWFSAMLRANPAC